MKIHIVSLIVVSMLAACDTQTPGPSKEPTPKVFSSQMQALEKAKGVGQTIQQQNEQMRDHIDQSSK